VALKNQVLVDGHKQIKDGRNPFSQWQQVTSFEDKITYFRKLKPKEWWNLDVITSLNSYTVWSYRAGTSRRLCIRRDLQFNDAAMSKTRSRQTTSLQRDPESRLRRQRNLVADEARTTVSGAASSTIRHFRAAQCDDRFSLRLCRRAFLAPCRLV